MEELLASLMLKYPIVGYVLMGLGALVVLAQSIIVLTPSKADDAFWDKMKAIPVLGTLISALAEMAPIKKK